MEYVASYDGNTWTGPIYLAHSDNLLDNRPAVVVDQAGRADGDRLLGRPRRLPGRAAGCRRLRQALRHIGGTVADKASPTMAPAAMMCNLPGKDPYNNDLYAAAVVARTGFGDGP